MAQLSKLQIRAKVLAVISEVKMTPVFNEEMLDKFVCELSEIEDRKSLFDIFIKEFMRMEEHEYMFSSCLLKELVPVEYISDKVFELLKSASLQDDAKYKLVQLLRVIGNADYNDLPSYFENPDEVIDLETKKLLETAVFNPESMLDFLDFVYVVPDKDRSILLNSLSMDYKGDMLANIIYPILYSDFGDKLILETIEILSGSKSSLALAPFEYLIKTSDNEEIISACEKGLKKLKLSGASPEKAENYFINIIQDSVPAQFFTTIPDGNGNQAFLSSRINAMGNCLLSAVVANDKTGIVDCFGFFNISKEELIKIIDKFYKSEGKYSVSPEYIKTKINSAIEKTIMEKRTFPYEFICWNPILADIKPLDESVETYVKNKCKQQLISKKEILKLLTKSYTLRWFISPNDNNIIKSLIEEFYSNSDITIDEINSKITENINNIFDLKTETLWKNKFYDLIYLLRTDGKLKEADNFYTLLVNDELFDVFKRVVMQRSIFNNLVYLIQNSKDSEFTPNIFRKKNVNEPKYDVKRLENLTKMLEKDWINE